MAEKTELTSFIAAGVELYHRKIVSNLQKLKLNSVLQRKNPFLFRTKSIQSGRELVKSLLDAHLSSQEEAIFGGFLEELAIDICQNSYGGKKSAAEGIDLEFERDNIKYLVSIKSGPNWGNSSSIKKLQDNFKKAKRILGTNAAQQNVVAINGCCYGKQNLDKGDYKKICGQKFWELVSGEEELYMNIIKTLGEVAGSENENFEESYDKVLNKFVEEFERQFCAENGEIDWDKLLSFNSGNATAGN